MRTIKFRGKSIEDGVWRYGSLVVVDDNKNDPFRVKPIKQIFQIVCYNQGDWNMGGWDYVNVDSNTIGQFTGFCDKNGQEIYEGDILLNHLNNKFTIVYYRGSLILVDEDKNPWETCIPIGIHLQYMTIEVVGNIHDNKNLLPKGDQE